MSASPLIRYRTPLAISSWVTFAISLAFYWITVDPGVSYWDCAEYVTTASRLEVGHPPGNPIWMLVMRVATIPFSPQNHALVINLCSGLFMAFAAFFLCRIIFVAACRACNIVGTSFIAAAASLCFALCDSAWFSAVEAEVYAMSTFLSALSLWIMVKWWYESDSGGRQRLLILLAYITGLSLGVHQLNLLLIPVFGLIIFYRVHPGKVNPILILGTLLLSVAIIGFILLGVMPYSLFGAQKVELFTTNRLGWPYNTGTVMFVSLIFLAILFALIFVRHRFFNLVLWMGGFLLLGYSSFAIVMIRSMANPAMNEGVPSNIFTLQAYIARDQYPSTPLIYGATPFSKPLFEEEFRDGKPYYSRYLLEKGKPFYLPYSEGALLNHRSRLLSASDSAANKDVFSQNHGYILSDYDFSQQLTPELNMWFPRISSRNSSHLAAYEDWAGMTEENMSRIRVSETMDSNGRYLPRMVSDGSRPPVYSLRPTYWQNFRFFLSYQAYYMYFRYLFWNFIGRQNDYPSTGEIEHGNFITGLSYIDSEWLGTTEKMPQEIGEDNKGRNRYFGIPFILGILGILCLWSYNRRSRRILTVTALIFFMTGLAIVFYLNQSPGEPRERDYTFLVSYMAFAMWIGAGLWGIFMMLERFLPRKAALIIFCVLSICPPTLMALENFDDHDRRNRFEPTFYASSLLDYEIPSIIFSHGDNSTFPLWYATEVLGMGENHLPVDITYLALPSYVVNLKNQGHKGTPTIATSPQIAYGRYLLTRIPHDSLSVPLSLTQMLHRLYSTEDTEPTLPASSFKIPSSSGDSVVISLKDFTGGSNYLSFKHLMLLDILAAQLESENPKALYFPALIQQSFYKPLEPVLRPALFGKVYAPWLPDSTLERQIAVAARRELDKLETQYTKANYLDPVIADRSRRYRGEMLMAAEELLNNGDTVTASLIANDITKYYPYSLLLPGDFTVADTTFYEGKAYRSLLLSLYEATGNSSYLHKSLEMDSLLSHRHKAWLNYYYSLSPSQRRTLSNRSKRLLIK
ncbi:MAG: DUF2723 domain-containing protein [Muribaculaceae bacterium]|nr:DUF2723 domain-containing protein [Muribaculaceae bacterium]